MNHPYCNSGSDITLNRLSTICRPISLKSPIMIEDQVCGRPEPCAPTHNLPLIAASSLFAALFLAVGLILYHRYVITRMTTSRNSKGHYRWTYGKREL